MAAPAASSAEPYDDTAEPRTLRVVKGLREDALLFTHELPHHTAMEATGTLERYLQLYNVYSEILEKIGATTGINPRGARFHTEYTLVAGDKVVENWDKLVDILDTMIEVQHPTDEDNRLRLVSIDKSFKKSKIAARWMSERGELEFIEDDVFIPITATPPEVTALVVERLSDAGVLEATGSAPEDIVAHMMPAFRPTEGFDYPWFDRAYVIDQMYEARCPEEKRRNPKAYRCLLGGIETVSWFDPNNPRAPAYTLLGYDTKHRRYVIQVVGQVADEQ